MKKCNRYLEALDQNAAEDSAHWQDVLMHASRCPDCSSDIKLRAEMLEKLAEAPPPPYPEDLHAGIMAAIAQNHGINASGDEPGLISRLFEKFLQPIEIAVPAACVLMFVFLMQINYEPGNDNSQLKAMTGAPRGQVVRLAELPPPEPGTLEHVSREEVKDFLVKLEEFRRDHPDEQVPSRPYLPAIELVNDN